VSSSNLEQDLERARRLVDPPADMSDRAFVVWMAYQIRDLRKKAYGVSESAPVAQTLLPFPESGAESETARWVRRVMYLEGLMLKLRDVLDGMDV